MNSIKQVTRKVWIGLRGKVNARAGMNAPRENEATKVPQGVHKEGFATGLVPQTFSSPKKPRDEVPSAPGHEPSNARLWLQRKRKPVALSAIALVILVVGVSVVWNAATRAFVPDIQGQSVVEALASLEAVGLAGTVSEDGCSESAIAIPDSVCLVEKQSVAPGTKLRKGDVVLLSSHLDSVKVPDVVGMTLQQAKVALAEALFLAERKPESNGKIEALVAARGKEIDGWMVTQQNPRAAGNLVAGNIVKLELELPKVTVPDVVGMTVGEAELILGPAELLLAATYQSESTIAGQSLISGATAQLGSTLSLSFVVPDVVGLSVNEAKSSLASANFSLEIASSILETTLIASHEPSAGQVVTGGTTINALYQVPNLSGLTIPEARNAAKGAGLSLVIAQEGAPDDSVLSDQSLPAGSEATPGGTITGTAARSVPTYSSGSSLSEVQRNLEAAHFVVVLSPSNARTTWRISGIDPQPGGLATYGSTVTIYLEDPTPIASSGVGQAGSSVYYKNCTEARNAGVTPIYQGQPGYGSHLDRDNDGIACE